MNKARSILAVGLTAFLMYKLLKTSKKPPKTANLKLVTMSSELRNHKDLTERFKNSRIIYISNVKDDSPDSLLYSNLEGKRHLINHLKPNLHLDITEIELRQIPVEIIKLSQK